MANNSISKKRFELKLMPACLLLYINPGGLNRE